MVRFLLASLMVLVTAASSAPPQGQDPDGKEVRKGWIAVVLGDDGKPKETIGAFLTLEESRAAERQWTARHPGTTMLTDSIEGDVEVKRRPTSKAGPGGQPAPSSGTDGSAVVVPGPKFMDPGGAKRIEKRPPSLAGKRGTGTIGKSKVTIDFTGEGEKGEFVVGGELTGKGKWVRLGPFVQLETTLAKFEGRLDGDKLAGTRTMKQGGGKDAWSLDFAPVPRRASAEDRRDDAASDPKKSHRDLFLGTFTLSTHIKQTIDVQPNGKARIRTTYESGAATDETYSWKYFAAGEPEVYPEIGSREPAKAWGDGYGALHVLRPGVGIIHSIYYVRDGGEKRIYKNEGGVVLKKTK